MIQIFDSMTELLESVPKENMTFEMCNAFVKAWVKIHGYGGGKSEVHPFTIDRPPPDGFLLSGIHPLLQLRQGQVR